MDRTKLNTFGLCTGIGMLEAAVDIGCAHFGWRAKPACLCEWEAFATAVLLARMEDSALEPCPIWCGDLAEFDARPFRGVVDILTAGLPCPAFSVAGAKKGLADQRAWGDERSPIPQFLRIVGECGPALVFIENVPPFVRGGHFRPVGEELCRLGYEIETPLFVTASSVGASHERERVFILCMAQSARGRFRELWESSRRDGFADGSDEKLANAKIARSRRLPKSNRRIKDCDLNRSVINVGNASGERASEPRQPDERQPVEQSGRSNGTGGSGESLADTSGQHDGGRGHRRGMDAGPEASQDRRPGATDGTDAVQPDLGDTKQPGPQRNGPAEPERWSESVSSNRDWGIFAPGPNANWQDIPPHLYPAIERGLRVLADGNAGLVVDASRADQLRCGGNAVVATAAAVAFVELMRRVLEN